MSPPPHQVAKRRRGSHRGPSVSTDEGGAIGVTRIRELGIHASAIRKVEGVMSEAVPVKETKAQRSERLKQEKNPWEAFDEVRQFAREGRATVLPEWASFYFKWWRVYTQRAGVRATGRKSS